MATQHVIRCVIKPAWVLLKVLNGLACRVMLIPPYLYSKHAILCNTRIAEIKMMRYDCKTENELMMKIYM